MKAQVKYSVISRVLIAGKGLLSEALVPELEILGYAVVHSKGAVQHINGFAGDFLVTLKADDETEGFEVRTERVGAIVLAPELEEDDPSGTYPLRPEARNVTLESLLSEFPLGGSACKGSPEEHKGTIDPGRNGGMRSTLTPESYVAILLGLCSEGNTADMHLALHISLEMRRATGAQVFIFCRNVKVAEEGLERLYQTCRDEGVIFFKFDGAGPDLHQEGDRVSLHFTDPVLEQPFELTPDWLGLDSVKHLPAEVGRTALTSGVGLDRSGYLQPANVHFLPQASRREGIFLAGSGRGPLFPGHCLEEARATALSIHHFFQGSAVDPQDREVTVDKGLCTLCLTCFRFCPHQAIAWSHRVFIHPLACRRCGICASECPMDAIQIAGYADEDVERFLKGLPERWNRSERPGPRIVCFGCRRSAGAAWKEVHEAGYAVEGELEFLELPCAGKLDPGHVLKALSLGADGVLVLACPEENCKSLHGNTYARERMDEARHYLAEAGLDPERIRFDSLSGNMAWYLKEILGQFLNGLKETMGAKPEIPDSL